jgi:two-component system, NtrC family, sensor kinase
LLSNARDSLNQKILINSIFSPEINLTTSQHHSIIEIKVRDNGMGISKNNLDHIFAPFWTTKNSVDGVGVGLFFSRQRIEKYNGTIKVESREGEWTEFTITLPINNNE